MDVMDNYRQEYEYFKSNVDHVTNKYRWAARKVFGLITYDDELDEKIVKKILTVCKIILNHATYEYIHTDETNYKIYILVCQLLNHKNWINWGSSIRGAWFDTGYNEDPILDNEYFDDAGNRKKIRVPFTEENILKLIQFIEEE